MKLFRGNLIKRHIAKTISWRLVATSDTVIISYFISGDLSIGIKIGVLEIFTKMVFYYLHERFWYHSKVTNYKLRHILKTFSWRLCGTIDTILISTLISGNLNLGFKIGTIELLTKMVLYYIHEKLWYNNDYGLGKSRIK